MTINVKISQCSNFYDILLKCPNCFTLLEANRIIHEPVVKALDSVITLHDMLLKCPNCFTLLEANRIIHDSIIKVS